MRLKRVRIFGFKTFAEKTEFDLDGDIVAIVGPNGCGKSNIVDAILWGLGEPNARNLRATTGLDVIFNGSAKRKALGFAEVTLVFDNEDGALPIQAAEVAVTRRFTRAGDSHFSINRKACRLKDIYDLLADSGLGRAGYAIVGQREIDQALSASAEERRAWIDEAAGVQRFRAKRLESNRRMEAAKSHLERIDQILGDIEFQREPLREEAEIAKRYVSIKSTLTELEVDLLVHEVCSAASEAETLAAKLASTSKGAEAELARADSLGVEIKRVGEEIAELERQLDANRELRQRQLSMAEKAESDVSLATQRLDSLDEIENNLAGEQSQSDEQIAAANMELAEAQSRLEEANSLLAQLQSQDAGSDQELLDLQQQIKDIDEQLQHAKAAETKAQKALAEAEHAARRKADIKVELAGIDAGLPAINEALAEAQLAVVAVRDKESIELEALASLDTQLAAIHVEMDGCRVAQRQLLSEHSALEGKKRGLEATLETMDGLGQGSQAVLSLVRKGELPSEYEPVASAVSTKSEWATAIETALGGAAHDLIVSDERFAKQAIELLKDRRLGRATFQPLTLMRPSTPNPELRKVESQRGVVGIAADLVECSGRTRPVIQSLLGRIVVVESLDDSLRLSRTQGWSRLVTLDGEVVHYGGAVTGGRTGRQTSGILHRKAELSETVQRAESVQRALAEIDQKLELLSRALESAESDRQTPLIKLAKLKCELGECNNWLNSLNQELAATDRERERLLREAAQLEEVAARRVEAPADHQKLAELRDEVLTSLARKRADSDASVARVRDADEQVRHAVLGRDRASQRLERAQNSKLSREDRLAGLEAERDQWREKIEVSKQSHHAHAQQAADLVQLLDSIQQQRKEHLDASFKLEEERKAADRAHLELGNIVHKLKVDRARSETRRSVAVQRLVEEYAMSEEDALERGVVADLPADAQLVVGRLRRDLKSLGEVNVGAIEAYERLTQRFSELDLQRQDVAASLVEIQSAVKELDRLTRDRFLGTFERVRDEFKKTFAELFGGGEAQLSLTDTEHLLSSGVDVEVTVPGKKRQRLELLSGGERSMSAIAFLFALLRVKPSPLVVLDEVDAPLDGRNVERYVEVLKSFRESTQFLVITHNPVTIEAAPIWFGVTMQEPGCTTVIPCKVPEREGLMASVVPAQLLN